MDELVTWKQLTWDRRLSDALCDERGWDALSLAAKELTRLFPNIRPKPSPCSMSIRPAVANNTAHPAKIFSLASMTCV
jgi:hypothetical protein